VLKKLTPVLEGLSDWTQDGILGALTAFAEAEGMKNATAMWPLRIAVSGMAVTPGGAVEICRILGKEETLRRMALGIEKLSA
jgi:glutamyl-tRNA synthetase